MEWIKVKGILHKPPKDIWDNVTYSDVEEGLYLVDDGIIYTMMFVDKSTDPLIPSLNGFTVPREYVDIEDKSAAVERDFKTEILHKLDQIKKEVEVTPDRVEMLIGDNISGNNTDINAIVKLVAVSQKPELIKE